MCDWILTWAPRLRFFLEAVQPAGYRCGVPAQPDPGSLRLVLPRSTPNPFFHKRTLDDVIAARDSQALVASTDWVISASVTYRCYQVASALHKKAVSLPDESKDPNESLPQSLLWGSKGWVVDSDSYQCSKAGVSTRHIQPNFGQAIVKPWTGPGSAVVRFGLMEPDKPWGLDRPVSGT